MIRQSASVLVLLLALVPPAAADPAAPGPGPGRVFGFFNPETGKFTMKENGAIAPRAGTKPVGGILTVSVLAQVSKPDPTGTIRCSAAYDITAGETAYAPVQSANQAVQKLFKFTIGYIFSGRVIGAATAACLAFTASGEQSGNATQFVVFTNPTEEVVVRVLLQ